MLVINKKISNLFLMVFILLVSCSTDEINNSSDIDLSLVNENNWIMSNNILNYINDYRLQNDLNLLIKDSSYATAYAVSHSKYMIETQSVNHNNFFVRSNGLKNRGAIKVSENVAYGYTSAQSVVNAWLNSQEHKEIIEGDFTNIGFGVIKSELNNKYYFTTIYYK